MRITYSILRLFGWLLSAALIIASVAFSLNNQAPTIISLWPFGMEMALPIYLLALIPLVVGLLVGGAVVWIQSFKYWVASKRLASDVVRLEKQLGETRLELSEMKAGVRTQPQQEQWRVPLLPWV